MFHRGAVLAAGVLLATNQLAAAQTIMGAGTASCGEWLKLRIHIQ